EPVLGADLRLVALLGDGDCGGGLVRALLVHDGGGLYSPPPAEIGADMATDESVTVKGSPVRSLQKFLETELTPEQRETVFASLPAPFATRLRGPVLATETIPI